MAVQHQYLIDHTPFLLYNYNFGNSVFTDWNTHMKTLQEKTKTVKSDFPNISNKELLRILIYDVIEELKHHKRRHVLNMMRESGVQWTLASFDDSYHKVKKEALEPQEVAPNSLTAHCLSFIWFRRQARPTSPWGLACLWRCWCYC